MSQWKSISDIRREYGHLSLSEGSMPESPFEQFSLWFDEVLKSEASDPTAMVLSTVDKNGLPDSRVVLLKGIFDNAFVFFTNYQSTKATQINQNPQVALNFYWPQMARQVRIRGRIKKTLSSQSDTYFLSRPQASQISAVASPQSQVVGSREVLEEKINELIAEHQKKPVVRPEFWGGYQVLPTEIEFWQGRDNRLHDRIQYILQKGQWLHRRLAP